MKRNKPVLTSGWLRRFWITIAQHSVLIACAVMFSFPFFWMMMTSAKVDRELFAEHMRLLPLTPWPAQRSPYVARPLDHAAPWPEDVPAAAIARWQDPVTSQLARVVTAYLAPRVATGIPAIHDAMVAALWQRVLATTPPAQWTNPATRVAGIVRRVTVPRELAGAFDERYRRLSLRFSRVRDVAMEIHNLSEGAAATSCWHSLDTATAWLMPHADDGQVWLDVGYNFTHTNRVMVQAEFDVPFPASNLFQYCLGFRPDDSWHRLQACVEGGGLRIESVEPLYLFDTLWSMAIWQRPSAQDHEIKIKRWICCAYTGRGAQYDLGPTRVRVTLTLRRSSLLQAWVGKLCRNYRSAFKYIPFWRYVGTSVFLVVLNIIGTLFSSTFVAYAFARLRWPGRDVCFMALLATLMIPGQVTMIPGFLIIKSLGWYNTLQSLWVFSWFGNAFYIFLLRQFMKSIPNDLEDAARIDGCGFLRIYWYVVLPLIKPTMAAIAIFTFMGVWNDFMGPLIMLNDHRLYPLSLGLFALNVDAGGNFGMMMASSLMMTVPVVVIFFFAQKYFIQGVTLTGMKG